MQRSKTKIKMPVPIHRTKAHSVRSTCHAAADTAKASYSSGRGQKSKHRFQFTGQKHVRCVQSATLPLTMPKHRTAAVEDKRHCGPRKHRLQPTGQQVDSICHAATAIGDKQAMQQRSVSQGIETYLKGTSSRPVGQDGRRQWPYLQFAPWLLA